MREAQDPRTGLVPPLDPAGVPAALPGGFASHDRATAPGTGSARDAQYHVLCVGYALDLLGSGFAHPVHAVAEMAPGELTAALDALPWDTLAWSSGAWIDAWATAVHWNLGLGEPGAPGALEALYGWLLTRVDPWTGLWGSPSAAEGRRQVVNGYYRLTRGSYAQFGLPVPYPERVVDTALDHAADVRYFAPGREDACSVLDVAHPLWLCRLQTSHRTPEVQAWARGQLDRLLERWAPGLGLGFAAGPQPARPGSSAEPGLQGTEMWLAIAWLLADLVGAADALGYRPQGVHRPEPARTLPGLTLPARTTPGRTPPGR